MPPAKKARVGDTTLYRLKVRRAWGAPSTPPTGGVPRAAAVRQVGGKGGG